MGNIYIFDSSNCRIRKISAGGVITSVVGTGSCGFGGYAATLAKISSLKGLVTDGLGNMYFADSNNARIRMVTVKTGIMATVCENTDDGRTATSAEIDLPFSLGIDASNNIYIADLIGYRVRMIAAFTGIVSNVVILPSKPFGICFDQLGNMHVTMQSSQLVVSVANSAASSTTPTGEFITYFVIVYPNPCLFIITIYIIFIITIFYFNYRH